MKKHDQEWLLLYAQILGGTLELKKNDEPVDKLHRLDIAEWLPFNNVLATTTRDNRRYCLKAHWITLRRHLLACGYDLEQSVLISRNCWHIAQAHWHLNPNELMSETLVAENLKRLEEEKADIDFAGTDYPL